MSESLPDSGAQNSRQQEDGVPAETARNDDNGPNNKSNGTPPKQDSPAWADLAQRLWAHDETTVKAWDREIDTFLVFVSTHLADVEHK